MERPPLPADIVERANAGRGGFSKLYGLRFVKVDYDEIQVEVPVTPDLHQPHGLVHGGVYAAIVETVASVGPNLACPPGHAVVGLENTTSFLRAVRSGTLRGRGYPLQSGRRTSVWAVDIIDDDGRLVARGQLRCLVVERPDQLGAPPPARE